MKALITALAGAYTSTLKKFPDYDDKRVEQYEEKLNEYLTEIHTERPDSYDIGELHDWLLSHVKPDNFKA